MAGYVQADRPLTMTTPLGKDVLLLIGLHGAERVSGLFRFDLEAIAEKDSKVTFDSLLGKKVTAHLRAPGGNTRHFCGICCAVAQGGRDSTFTTYRLQIVPEFWFLTKRSQSRIFQAKSVPDILKQVLQQLSVTYKLQGRYEPRDYCVQYRETDFQFASRLMEEEGISYFFTHGDGETTMVLTDSPSGFPQAPFEPQVTYAALDDTNVDEDRVHSWTKVQELRSGKVTLWDHSFEKPHEHLDADKTIQDAATAGTVDHRLKIGAADKLELYDWPGGYAGRFDGVGPGREDRPSDISKIFQDNKRTVGIRMEQEASGGLAASGESNLRQLTAGHKIALKEHYDADGPYLLTEVTHSARMTSNYRSGEWDDSFYDNGFACVPASLPLRPAMVTQRPVVRGSQTAVVVGPKGEELYTDKYGRVKVQFHWDREGKNDQKSSCWIRVAQPLAGRRWGSSFWPRIGQEVLVDFIEGDPDQPIIVGSVYNADQMPPYLGKGPDSKHADDNKVSGIKTNSTKGGDGYNELRFDDNKGKEQVFVHAQHDYDLRVRNDAKERVYGNHHHIVGYEKDGKKGGDLREQIHQSRHVHIEKDRIEHVEGNVQLLVGKGSASGGGGDMHVSVEKNRSDKMGGSLYIDVGSERHEKVATKSYHEAGQELHVKAGMKVVIEAGMSLTIKGPGGFITIGPEGITIEGTLVKINCGGSPQAAEPAKPVAPIEAKPTQPAQADDAVTGKKSD